MTVSVPPALSAAERRALLRLARAAVVAAVGAAPPADAPAGSASGAPAKSTAPAADGSPSAAADAPPPGSTGGDPPGRLGRPGGAFVTLRLEGRLRGCVGHIEASDPLAETVRRVAALAATADPRFDAVTAAELPRVTVEVSVLGPLYEPDDPASLKIGRHGVVVDDGPCRGLLLPQVAVERGWDARRFLREACRKAGLSGNAWRRTARVRVFDAEVIAEPR